MKELDAYDKKILKKLLSLSKRDDNGCLIFTGSKTVYGYGQIGFKGTKVRVHRLIMYLLHGFDLNSPLPILHKNFICKSKACFDDTHLYIGDASKNMLDAMEIGLDSYGSRNAAKIHCGICGFPLSGDNLLMTNRGTKRTCINCKRKHDKEFNEKRKLRGKGQNVTGKNKTIN